MHQRNDVPSPVSKNDYCGTLPINSEKSDIM